MDERHCTLKQMTLVNVETRGGADVTPHHPMGALASLTPSSTRAAPYGAGVLSKSGKDAGAVLPPRALGEAHAVH
jgi:hypothetical protein